MFDFFGKGFFNLDVDDKCDLIFLFILNLDVYDFYKYSDVTKL